MLLVLVRHADAGDREAFAESGKPDEFRPLSDKGRKQMKAAADGLRALVPKVDVIVTSPYTRAVETAAIVADAYGHKEQETSATLEPDSAPEDFAAWIHSQNDPDVAIVVGHEPHLGELATWLMTGVRESHVEFKKGGAGLLAFDGGVKKAAGILQWLLTGKQLARVGTS